MTRLQEQVDELALLESMFSCPGEFQIEDQASQKQAEAFLRHLAPDPPKCLSCRLCIPTSAHQGSDVEDDCSDGGGGPPTPFTIHISVRLPSSYPDSLPEIHLSANELKRCSQDELNSDLRVFAESLPPGEACLLPIVEWARDNADAYFPVPCISKPEMDVNVDTTADSHVCRMWLYMHHIYSKTKRRNILSLCGELELSGFCLPGKPGVVCVEGTVRTTREFYAALRRWNWKSIACRRREVGTDTDLASWRKIQGFSELSFDLHGHRQGHMDMGQFLSYLHTHNLQYMFKELFGVEGHHPTD